MNMDLLLVLSIVIRLWALGWSVIFLRRLRDWRIGVLAAMFALMATRQILAVATKSHDCWFCLSSHHLTELPGLVVSVVALCVVVILERMLQERKQSEILLRQQHAFLEMLQKVTAAANTSANVDEALQTTLEAICNHTGWPVGHVYRKEKTEGGLLKPTKLWHLHDPGRFETFRSETESMPFDAGVDLPGRVLASGEPAWIMDVTQDDNFLRAQAAIEAGMRGGFAFPVLVGRDVVAVLEFFSPEVEAPDRPLLEVIPSVGMELGRAIERERAVRVIGESKRLLQSVTDNASAVIYIKDLQGRYLLINRRFEEIFEVSCEQVVGKTDRDIFPNEFADKIHVNDRKVMEHQGPLEFEEVVPHVDDGQMHTYLSDKFPLYDTKGQIYAVCGISADITQRKRDEEKLRFTQFLVDHAGDAVFTINKDGRFIAVNNTACLQMEYSRRELLEMAVWDINPNCPKEDWPAVWDQVSQEKQVTMEANYVAKSGRVIPVEIVGRYIQYEGNECVCSFVRDITDRKRAEVALRESEMRSRALLDGSPVCNKIIDLDFRLQYMSAAGINRLKIADIEPFYGQPFPPDLYPEPMKKLVIEHLERAKVGEGSHVECFMHDMEGAGVWYDTTFVPICDKEGRIEHIIVTSVDITDRKRAQEELDRFFHLAVDMMCIADTNGYFRRINPSFSRVLGYSEEELLAKPFVDFIHPDDRDATKAELEKLADGKKVIGFRNRYVCKDGSLRWLEWSSSAVQEQGVVYAVAHDVTESRRAEEDLKQQTARFEAIFRGIPDSVVLVNRDREIVMCNPGTMRTYGYELEELLGQNSSMLYANKEDHVEVGNAHFDPDVPEDPKPYEMRYKRKDGEVFLGETVAGIVRDSDGKILGYLGLMRDVTDRVRVEQEKNLLEMELRQAQKMEAVGTLAGGIAHDFNNVLAAIFGHVEIAKDHLSREHPVADMLKTIERIVSQGESVTRALLTFAHKAPSKKRPVDLIRLVGEALQMLRPLLPASVTIAEDFPDEDELWIQADSGQIQQVLMNLVINARDAMKGRGCLQISLGLEPNEISGEGDAEQSAVPERAILVVGDTGPGMDKEIQDRIFEPFFTTKTRGAGTGLGLAVVHGIITDHNGQIEVQSADGVGTRFIIRLPLCRKPDNMRAVASQARVTETGTGQSILVAEDNESVRESVEMALNSAGYHVISAANGQEAMDLFGSHQDELSLAVLDLDMPKESGASCMTKIRRKRQQFPVVIVTGNVDISFEALSANKVSILKKPYRMAELVELVKKNLDEQEGRK